MSPPTHISDATSKPDAGCPWLPPPRDRRLGLHCQEPKICKSCLYFRTSSHTKPPLPASLPPTLSGLTMWIRNPELPPQTHEGVQGWGVGG